MSEKNNTPMVSIIMAAFNEEAHISAAIESIVNQTFTDWELIVIDDGSMDKTAKIVSSYAEIDPRIFLNINPRNKQLPACLNYAISVSRGKYIARADADDVCLPKRIELQYEYLEQNREVDVLGSAVKMVSDGEVISEYTPFEKCCELSEVRILDTLFIHPTVMFRKSFFDKVGFYSLDYIRAEDKELWLRGLVYGANYANLKEPLVLYSTNGFRRSYTSIFYRQKSLVALAIKYKKAYEIPQIVLSTAVMILVKLRLYTPKALRKKRS